MAKVVELRRHTANDGDVLTPEGVAAAVEIGRGLTGPYDLVVSSGAQRATQTAASFLAGLGRPVTEGVIVDAGFRSDHEERWREIYAETGRGDLEGFLVADYAFVEAEARLFAAALRRVADHTPEGTRALVVGHSPMIEACVWAATGRTIAPLGKGEGIALVLDGGAFRLGDG